MPLAPQPGIFICYPIYQPDPGHGERWEHPGPFYAIISKDWKRAVTSIETRDRMLEKYPDAYTWEASSWTLFDQRWMFDCTEYHNHEDRRSEWCQSTGPLSLSPLPSPTPSTAAPAPTATTLDAGRKQMSKEDLRYLADSRPARGPISTERLNQQFARVLGPHAVLPPGSQGLQEEQHHQVHPAQSLKASEVHAALRAGAQLIGTKDGPVLTWGHVDLKRPLASRSQHSRSPSAGVQSNSGAVLYAVSGHNRVFQSRDRAMAALQRSPGADLVFTRDENEVFRFLAEDEGENLP
ncbi:hypothetical protein MSAN_01390500 [Mycena sanguinolenta]|uniref:Uncharacterized protein n=1 Tax=Mycena sanguinolenta TaxID=230812 RepID=A0A8H7D110_9AGAR|nr:hypothetical protein MSAN_01390500 [Mycena sanguinolenta]